MYCTRTDEGEKTTIVIEGPLDAMAAPELGEMVNDIVNDRRIDVVVNMEKTTLLDAAGVGVLIALFKRIKSLDLNFRVRFEGVRDQPRAVLRLLRLDRVFGLE